MAASPDTVSMVIFCDFENVALGVRDAKYEKFDIKPVLERLLLKGSIVLKKAYCDWDRYKTFKATMHEANFELIEIPHARQFANCDEFIFYDDLVRESQRGAARRDPRALPTIAKRTPEELEARRGEAIELAVATFEALVSERGDTSKIWASMLKEAIKRRKPDFNESYFGFRSFGGLLEEAQNRGLLELGRDEKSGAFVSRGSGPTARAEAPQIESAPVVDAPVEASSAPEETDAAAKAPARRRGRGGKKSAESGASKKVPAKEATPAAETAPEAVDAAKPEAARAAEGKAEKTPRRGLAGRASRKQTRRRRRRVPWRRTETGFSPRGIFSGIYVGGLADFGGANRESRRGRPKSARSSSLAVSSRDRRSAGRFFPARLI